MGDGFSHIESALGVGSTGESEPQAIVQSAPMPMVKIETSPLSDEYLEKDLKHDYETCLLYTSPSPRDLSTSRMPSSA